MNQCKISNSSETWLPSYSLYRATHR